MPPSVPASTIPALLRDRINYERSASVPYRSRTFKLDRMQDLLARLGDPQRGLPVIHLAGTKGKGSTAAFLEHILLEAGLRVGTYTSPHLAGLEERLRVGGRPCTADQLQQLVQRVREPVAEMDHQAGSGDDPGGPTYFEITTAMALLHFAAQPLDAVILEVGLGGRLDSTNVCDPLVCAITSISLDHTEQLGDTLEAIAGEKAGIIKPNVPVVSGVTQPGPAAVIHDVAQSRGAPLDVAGQAFQFGYRAEDTRETGNTAGNSTTVGSTGTGRFWFRETPLTNSVPPECLLQLDDVAIGLRGRHQASNAAVALAVVSRLRRQGWHVSDTAIRHGLAATRCPARVEITKEHPLVLLDAAHNVASVEALLEAIDELAPSSNRRKTLIFATSCDKDARGMLSKLLPKFDRVLLTRYESNPRGIAAEELGALARELLASGELAELKRTPSIEEVHSPLAAWQSASRCGRDELICITGSFYLAAELRTQVVEPTL